MSVTTTRRQISAGRGRQLSRDEPTHWPNSVVLYLSVFIIDFFINDCADDCFRDTFSQQEWYINGDL